MRIINVSTDINSQKKIALTGMIPVESMVKTEVDDTTRVEAEEKTAQETQKKSRKTKRVSTEEV